MAVGLLALLGGTARAGYVDEVLADNPVVYYRFDETGSGSNQQARDSSNYLHHGWYNGGVSLGNPSAYAGLGTAAGFDNGVSDNNVSVPFLGTFNELTIEFWSKPNSYQTWDAVYNVYGWPDWAVHVQFLEDGRLNFSHKLSGNPNKPLGSLAQMPLHTWTHIAVTLDFSGKLELFTNGRSVATDSYGGQRTALLGSANIGAWGQGGDIKREFDGLIDEFAIYKSVLNEQRIEAHWVAAMVPEPSTLVLITPGLAGLLAFSRRRRKTA